MTYGTRFKKHELNPLASHASLTSGLRLFTTSGLALKPNANATELNSMELADRYLA